MKGLSWWEFSRPVSVFGVGAVALGGEGVRNRLRNHRSLLKPSMLVLFITLGVGFLMPVFGASTSQLRIGNVDDWFPPHIQTMSFEIGTPMVLKVGDFNGDGKADLLIAASEASSKQYRYKVFFIPGEGSGKFGSPLQVAQSPLIDDGERVGGGYGAVTDLDGDGYLDFIGFFETVSAIRSAPSTTTNQLLILWGNGNGGFRDEWRSLPFVIFPLVEPILPIAIGDFDGNGQLDIAYPCFDPLGVSILYNKGDRTLEGPKSVAISEKEGNTAAVPFDLVAADVNHDGKDDIVVGGSGVSAAKGSGQKQYKRFIKVFLSRGQGEFQQTFVQISTVPDLTAFAPPLWVGDLDTDGNMDLVLAEPFETQRPEEMFVNSRWVELIKMLKGKGDGTFIEVPILLAPHAPGKVGHRNAALIFKKK